MSRTRDQEPPDGAGPSGDGREHVPISELLDLDALQAGGKELTPREIRAHLPRGWVLDPDHRHAHRDVRLFFREGWILLCGLVIFGAIGGTFVWGGLPRGSEGILKLLLALVLLIVAGGVAGPTITRTLMRKK